jgi:methanogenic corrinoid protein MtbC1
LIKEKKMEVKLSQGIVDLKKDEVLEEVTQRAGKGEDPVKILAECQEGMAIIGDKFQEGEYFLAELLLSSEIFKAAVAELKPYLSKVGPQKKLGKVMMATLKGDIHDLGKNIFLDLISAHGFEVFDLGVDVDSKEIIEKVKEIKPDFLGFSALMTTTFRVMEDAARMLRDEDLRDDLKLMVGGGVTTPAVAELIGADFQTIDAMEGINFCKNSASGGI